MDTDLRKEFLPQRAQRNSFKADSANPLNSKRSGLLQARLVRRHSILNFSCCATELNAILDFRGVIFRKSEKRKRI
ncbi:MAG: hypothetical protein Q7T18_11365 [Sedimentisphaerales bacterium]|nr:hypothetical protein [Sedimentisphaerales bacterium]